MAILQQYSDLLLRGRVSVGYTYFTGLAKMDIAPGSASLAPLRVTPGTLLSSTVSGAIENDGDNLYWTDSDGVRSPLLSTVNYSQYGLSVLQAGRLATGRYIGIGGGVVAEASLFSGEGDLVLQVSSVHA
ncbi:MAG: hypothetical protein M0P69_06845, partial [Bacteroidales bacterium]|nr:hypothetical protein [Bacteroidales bacterium]